MNECTSPLPVSARIRHQWLALPSGQSTDAESRPVPSRSKGPTDRASGATYLEHPLRSQTDSSGTRREPTEEFPQMQIPQCSSKSLTPAFFHRLLLTPRGVQHSQAQAVTPGVLRCPNLREASPGSRLGLRAGCKRSSRGHSPALRAPGDDQQHLLVHPPRGAPGEMCPRGEGTFFSFSKRPQYAAIGPAYMQAPVTLPRRFWAAPGGSISCLHYFPVPSVSASPNALLMLPFFSVLSDFCFSCISNVPGNAIRISPFRLTARPELRSVPSQLSVWPCFFAGVPFLILFGHRAAWGSLGVLSPELASLTCPAS